jgi:hypothetical protein
MSNSASFLPPYLQTTPNKRFLGSTLDLLTAQAAVTRFDGYIGEKIYNGEVLDGNYLLESTPLRQAYQLEAAFVTKDINQNITKVSNFIDILNASANKNAITSSWNRLLTNNMYSWQGFNNLDKIINYQNYCWLSTDISWYWNNSILIQPINNVTEDIIGQLQYTDPFGITLMDGMIVSFPDSQPYPFNTSRYIVEGVGLEITLVPVTNIITPAFVKDQNNPPDYITIARNAIDLNLWSRTNLWVHKDTINSVINILASQQNITNISQSFNFAKRPIIEFTPLILFNSGKIGLNAINYFDNSTTDAFYIIQGQTNFECDGYQLNTGDSVIFNADHNLTIRQNVYNINFVDTNRITQIPRLYPVQALSNSNISLFGLQTIDGYITNIGDRILVLGQTDQTKNGIYIVSQLNWTLSDDFTGNDQVGVFVLYGLVNKLTYYIFTPANIICNPIIGSLTPTANSQIYTISLVPDPNTLLIWDNFPMIPEVGYTISGSTITFTVAPDPSDVLSFQAWPIGTAPITTPVSGVPAGVQDGINTVFTIPTPPDNSTLLVWDNFPLVNNIGYTLSGTVLTYTYAPAPTDNLFYQYWSKWAPSSAPVAQLVLRDTAQNKNCVIVTSGKTYTDDMVYWNSSFWNIASQNKTSINQTPKFDIFDLSGNSYGNNIIYPNTSFIGSELFSYEIGVGTNDPILGFPLSYGPVGNLNDVIFDNNYTTDTFSYTGLSIAQPIINGRAHSIDPITYNESIFDPWQYVNNNLELYQNYVTIGLSTISFNGTLLIKSTPNSQATQVFVDGTKIESSEFIVTESNGSITVTISSEINSNSIILIKILSSTPIPNAWYDVPPAFDHNPLGQMLSNFNMGQFRLHATTIQNNSNDTTGIINLFLKEFQGVPGSMLFQEAISILPTLLLCDNNFNIDQAIRTASDDYVLFKQRFINTASQLTNIGSLTIKQAVDQILQKIATTNITGQPWNTSDMCYWGGATKNITVTNTNLVTYNLQQTYNFTQPNSLELQIYKNNLQMIFGIDYSVSGNILTIISPLSLNDLLSIYEISNTNGNYIPATPTKLGLAAAYIPQIYMDYTYQIPRQVLQGHDGSITTCYGNYIDTLILDYELRVYNNLKVNNQFLFNTIQTHVPDGGRWRSEQAISNLSIAPYSPSELLTIQQRMFYEWTSEYNINSFNSFYDETDLFTWNWSSSLDKLSDHEPLLGYWRGIYRWFYDTEYVNIKPWESLGLSVKPSWWDETYGPAPYTGGNTVLWDDIAAGIIRDPNGIYYSPYGPKIFNSNSVTSVIPVDSFGNLLDPNDSIVGVFYNRTANYNFVFGDGGPTEEAWRRNSVYPFAKLRAQILQNPLFMCGSLWDTNNYLPTNGYNQFRYQNNYLGTIDQIVLNSVDNNGSAVVNSILNYSIEYLRKQGQDPSQLREAISNTSVQLMYPLGGFSDPNDLTAYGSPNNPTDVGAAELIPVHDYTLFLNKSTPTGTLNYSGLIISPVISNVSIFSSNIAPPINVTVTTATIEATANICLMTAGTTYVGGEYEEITYGNGPSPIEGIPEIGQELVVGALPNQEGDWIYTGLISNDDLAFAKLTWEGTPPAGNANGIGIPIIVPSVSSVVNIDFTLNPYGNGGGSDSILNYISGTNLTATILCNLLFVGGPDSGVGQTSIVLPLNIPGTILDVLAFNTTDYITYTTGDASLNPDNVIHANVTWSGIPPAGNSNGLGVPIIVPNVPATVTIGFNLTFGGGLFNEGVVQIVFSGTGGPIVFADGTCRVVFTSTTTSNTSNTSSQSTQTSFEIINTGTYQITGYNNINPFFTIYPANTYGPSIQIGVKPNFYKYPTKFSSTPSVVAYNTIFPDIQSVINFIAGYEAFLISNGLTFITNVSQTQVEWQSAAIQFIKWCLTNWGVSPVLSLILNPSSSIIQYNATSGTLYDLTDPLSSLVLDVNGDTITNKFLDVYRDVNSVTITHQGGGIFACVEADIVSYEHRVVFDNITAFNDTIYDPISAIRQTRLSFSGQKSANWNGTLDSPGFLICTNNVPLWIPNKDYLLGSLVQWKNNNYIATQDTIGAPTFQYSQFQLISTIFTNNILPNLSLKSIDYLNAYNINYRPFLTDFMSLRNNTIGYIERDWLTILDIDAGGQTDFYKGWIKEKGSLNSLNSYGRGSTSQLNTIIGINEEYAMKIGVYGSDLRTGYGEVSLPPIINTQNPLIISFVDYSNSNDTNSIQVTPNSLYEKSSNWTNDFIQNYGNLKLNTSNFTSGGPVIPQALVTLAKNTVPDFIKSDENSLNFSSFNSMVAAPQNSILKIAENGGSFWIENNNLIAGSNQWDVITFSSVSTEISSITQLNSNTICFILSTNIGTVANSVIVIDYTDFSSNISISGSFIVNDYFIAPFRTANSSGYSNLTITTTPNQFGNIFVNYANLVPTSGIYVSRSLRANSIAEGTTIDLDSTQYVINDATGEAAYNLTAPYQTEITYSDVLGGIPIGSIAYDSQNQIVWNGKPSAIPSGILELRVVGSNILSNGNILPTINTEIYTIQPKNPYSINFGNVLVAANNFAAASADTDGQPGQIYICNNVIRHAPIVTQILNGNTLIPYKVTNMAISDDASWLYAVEQSNGNISDIAVYALQNNPNINQTWFPTYTIIPTGANSSITLGEIIPNEYAITVSITNNIDYSSRVLIPEYEYTTVGTIINVNLTTSGIANISDANNTIAVTGISNYYQYQGTIVAADYGLTEFTPLSQFGASIACDSDGKTIAIGAPNNQGNVIVFSRIIENQYSQNGGLITPFNSYDTITNIKVNGLSVPPTPNVIVQAYSLIQFEGFCFNVQQIIPAPNIFDSGFGSSVAIQNNQLVIGSSNSTIGNQYNKGTVYVYALDTSITNSKIIPISDLVLSTTPFMINGWLVTPLNATINGLIDAINITSGYTGITAATSNSNLVLTITPTLQSTGLGNLGA